MKSVDQCLACSSCPLGRFRAGCEGSHPGNCKDCSRPATDEFFTGSGGIGQDDCSTSKVAIIKPGCTNVQDCAAWYQGYKWAAVTFTHDSERFGMDISFSLVPQGKPDMREYIPPDNQTLFSPRLIPTLLSSYTSISLVN